MTGEKDEGEHACEPVPVTVTLKKKKQKDVKYSLHYTEWKWPNKIVCKNGPFFFLFFPFTNALAWSIPFGCLFFFYNFIVDNVR